MANFDGSISTEVSLSRILDEMIMDGTDIDVVVRFLRQHEKDIPDIFRDSAFVYDLYDFANIRDLDPFLVRHMVDLSAIDCFFAMNLYAAKVHERTVHTIPGLTGAVNKAIRDNLFFFLGNREQKTPISVLNGSISLWDYVNSITDIRDMRFFVRNSYMGRSLFMARNFLMLSSSAQFLVLSSIAPQIKNDWTTKAVVCNRVLAHFLLSLIKQMLRAGNTDMFNWILNVTCADKSSLVCVKVLDELRRVGFPKSISDMLCPEFESGKVTAEFAEVVFEMNLFGGQIEPMDVFLYIYLNRGKQFNSMLENTDFLDEFFNLTFEWRELEKLRDVKKK